MQYIWAFRWLLSCSVCSGERMRYWRFSGWRCRVDRIRVWDRQKVRHCSGWLSTKKTVDWTLKKFLQGVSTLAQLTVSLLQIRYGIISEYRRRDPSIMVEKFTLVQGDDSPPVVYLISLKWNGCTSGLNLSHLDEIREFAIHLQTKKILLLL